MSGKKRYLTPTSDKMETPSGIKMEFSVDIKRVKECLVEYKHHGENNVIENHHVAVTEWPNGEGWDVSFNDVIFQMDYNQWDALQKAMQEIQKGDGIPDSSGIGIDLEEGEGNSFFLKKRDHNLEEDELPF